jgi:hypothetical protein
MASARITRRAMLGSAGAASLSPVLPASAPDSQAPHTRLAFAADVSVGAAEIVAGQPGRRWSAVLGGNIHGPLLSGAVQGGRIDWHVDALSQSVEISARFGVLGRDGRLLEIRDRAVFPGSSLPASMTRIVTAPLLLEAAETVPAAPALLVGRLDASQFARGVVHLDAFEVL